MNQREEFSLETAACLWEAVLALRDQASGDPAARVLAAAIVRSCETVGTAALRLIAVGWTSAVKKAWQDVSGTYPLCFDWDFVPEWIVHHIDWSDPAHPTIRAQPLPKGGKLLTEPVLLPATSPTSETPVSEGI
ncbi:MULTISPECIES: hypothetical protein [Sphingobium]|jgi:hypothetical protein|uniref:hypothetical protein n=1 Tax=Sphingobium TaxID=165695 RepID=UPI001C105FD3|nr:hypothetical protein [Sphingobium sp. RSMS]UXC92936.1 hypothetical protein EGM87_21775 [Sphingobium sp. RSMS]